MHQWPGYIQFNILIIVGKKKEKIINMIIVLL